MSGGVMEIAKKRVKKRKVIKKMHQLLGVSADPCTYSPSDKFVSSSLVGVEVELEGVANLRIEDPNFNAFWNTVDDGSLRGGGREYVLSRPFAGNDLERALSLFDEHVAKSGHDIQVSERTSIHVHIDIRDLTFEQLTRYVSIYSIFEEALFNLVGKTRSNNIFATSLANANGNLSKLGMAGSEPSRDEVHHIMMHFTKYSACNLAAVGKYGSLEFRNHEGTYDVARITKWINILLLIKEAAINMEIPVSEIFSNISCDGTERFFRSVFKEYSDELNYDNLEFDMYNGLRLAQDIIYSQEIDISEEVPEVEDKKESAFAVYYHRRKPKRFDKRFEAYAGGGGGDFFGEMDYGRGGIDHRLGGAVPRPGGLRIMIDRNNRVGNVDVTLGGGA